MERLIDSLKASGVLKSPAIEAAFRSVDRRDFVLPEYRMFANIDTPLPIGEGQTISQPTTVAFMLELLEPKVGETIMDVGHGSGWQTAMLAAIVGERGRVHAIELLPALCALGVQNLAKYPDLVPRVIWHCQNATSGLPEASALVGGFDGIIAAAEVREVPLAWRSQLKLGGRLVYPKAGTIYRELKSGEESFTEEQHPGFVFVPFIEPE